MTGNTLIQFYQEAAALIRKDLNKQKTLLPPDTIRELCASHCRQHREVKKALISPPARTGREQKKLLGVIQQNFPLENITVENFDFLQMANRFEAMQCAALAVVTEKHFYNGSPSMLTGVTHLVKLPIIRWELLLDPYQLMQSQLWGADAVRMTIPLLDQSEIGAFIDQAEQLQLEVIAEVTAPRDLERISSYLPRLGAVYIDEPTLSFDELDLMLQQIPVDTPALINGDRLNSTQIRQAQCDGLLFFHGQAPEQE